MMYTVVQSLGVEGVCLLRVDLNVLDLPGVVIADCNAASDYVRFFGPATGLQEIDHDEVFSGSWDHLDYYRKTRHRSRMCAEVLVPDRVEPSLILGAYAGSPSALESLNKSVASLNITVDAYKFFG